MVQERAADSGEEWAAQGLEGPLSGLRSALQGEERIQLPSHLQGTGVMTSMTALSLEWSILHPWGTPPHTTGVPLYPLPATPLL